VRGAQLSRANFLLPQATTEDEEPEFRQDVTRATLVTVPAHGKPPRW
jgi:hypothetical protein